MITFLVVLYAGVGAWLNHLSAESYDARHPEEKLTTGEYIVTTLISMIAWPFVLWLAYKDTKDDK